MVEVLFPAVVEQVTSKRDSLGENRVHVTRDAVRPFRTSVT